MGKLMEEVMKEVNKEAQEEIMTKGLNNYSYQRIPFSSPRMNYCSFGGLPIGKLTEFFGEEHGGKTTTALDIVANYQNMEGARDVLYIDAENTLDIDWAQKLGVNVGSLYLLQPKTESAERIFDIICRNIETGETGLWVLDSLGVLLSQQEFEKGIEERTYGGISQGLTKFAKRVEGLMARHKCTGIGINQMRDKIGTMFPMQDTPGGRAWKHCCSVRMQFSRGKFVDEAGKELTRSAENPAGNIVLMSMVKNKTCPPTRRTGFYTLNYEQGIYYLKDLVDVAIKYGAINQKGAWFEIIDLETGEVVKSKIQGQARLYELLDTEPDTLELVENQVNIAMQGS